MEPERDGDIELQKGGYQDVALCTGVDGGGRGGFALSVGVDGTDGVGSGGGVGCDDNDGAGNVGRNRFWVEQWKFLGGGGTAGWFWTGTMVWLEGDFLVLE